MRTFFQFFACTAFLIICSMAGYAQISFVNANDRIPLQDMFSGCSMTMVDWNHDGLDDIIRLERGRAVYVEVQQPDHTFQTRFLGNFSANNGWAWAMAVADFDKNGYKDIIAGNNGSVRIMMVNNQGTSGAVSTLPHSGFFTQNITCADFNGDGWVDAYVCDDNNYSKVYMNDGSGALKFLNNTNAQLTIETGSKTFSVQDATQHPVGQVVYIGYDNQNYMRGAVTQRNGNQLTVNVNETAGAGTYGGWSVHPEIIFNHRIRPDVTYGSDPADSGNYGSGFIDFDDDGDLDLYVAHCRQSANSSTDLRRKDRLFVNDGNNRFRDQAGFFGIEATVFDQTWTSSFGDVDNDGDFDLLLTNHNVISRIYENDGQGHFTDITPATQFNISNITPIESFMEDFDNDGFIDIIVTGSNVRLWKNNGDKTFSLVSPVFNGNAMLSFAAGDANHDGKIDLFASYGTMYNNPSNSIKDVLWLNNTDNENHFITFDLEGTISNKDAIGTKVKIYGPWGIQVREVRSGESYGTVNSFKLHFGLGDATMIDSARISWPNGQIQWLYNLPADQFVKVVQNTCVSPTAVLNPGNAGLVLCEGQTLDISVQSDEGSEFLWSNGATTQTITVSDAGSYHVRVANADGSCAVYSKSVSVSFNPDETPSIFAAGKTEFCRGEGSVTLVGPANVNEPVWSNGTTGIFNTVTESGVYTLQIAGACGLFTSNPIVVMAYEAVPPAVENITINTPQSVMLNASGSNLTWYADAAGSEPLATGNTFQTPVLSNTTEYFVQSAYLFGQNELYNGMFEHSGVSQFSDNLTNAEMYFDVYDECKLLSVLVYTDRAGTRRIEIKDDLGEIVHSLDVDIPVAPEGFEVALNFDLTPGSNYKITTNATVNTQMPGWGLPSPRLRRNNTDVQMPYTIDNVMSITSTSFGNGFYYYFYRWLVQTKQEQCLSELVPVKVIYDAGLGVASISQNALLLYPNPASDQLIVQSPFAEYTMEVLDLTGRLVYSNREVNSQTSLSTQLWANGLYLVKISNGQQMAQGKVLISH